MKSTLLALFAFGFVPFLGFTPGASGAVITTSFSTTAPSEQNSLVRVAVDTADLGTSYMMRHLRNYTTANDRWREIGQSFITPGTQDVMIDGLALRINDNRDISGIARDFTLTIYKSGAQGLPSGDAIYQGTGSLPTSLSTLGYITFQLGEEVALEGGVQYCFQIGFTAEGGNAQLSFAASKGSLYAGRSFYYANSDSADTAALVYTSAQRDLDFAVLYTPVPEGRTAFLLGGPLLLLAVFSHKLKSRAAGAKA